LAAKKSVIVLNAPGVVDVDYKDEIKVILHNFGRIPFKIKAGDRIAQGMVIKFQHADGLTVLSHIRSGGLGSTGV
jgi:dUTP pyrophosphatase